MARRGGSRSSFGVLQIVLGVAVLLGVGVLVAVMFAPEKPPAPPTSKVTYRAASPKEKKLDTSNDPLPLPDVPGLPRRPDQKKAAEKPVAEEKKEKPFKVIGLVIDARTKQPIDNAVVILRRKWSPVEQREWEAKNAQARLGTDQALMRAIRDDKERLQASGRTRTKDGGHFEIGMDVDGLFEVEAVHKQYMLTKVDAGVLNAGAPALEIQVALSTGATISGKVTEIGSPTPAPGVRVMIENDSVHSATTDDKGEYQIGGLTVGEVGVLASTQGTAYKPGRTLPYQKVTVQSAGQDIRNINFEVEPAGVVWGYIKTPENTPIKGADVLLMAPESLLSQAITAAIKQAPPVRGTSQEDGYYELLGVPINQEWRVYATSSSASPQLAEPFMLTGEVRSVQIDVYLYGGSDVHGVVVDSGNQPIAEANVTCIPSYTSMLSPTDAPAAFRNTKSDASGGFTIEKLPAGDYQVMAQKKDYKIPTMGTSIYPDGFSALEGVEVRLLPVDEGTHYVTGVVTDVRTREAIPGATVKLNGFGSETMNNFGRDTSTDSSGRYRIDGLEAGMYRLSVSKEGYATKTLPRVLLDGETPVSLDQSGVVRGFVLVKGSRSAPKVEYSVIPALLSDSGSVNIFGSQDLGDVGGTSFSSPDGSFQLFLPPGNYRIEARAEGYTPGREMISLAAAQVLDNVILYVDEGGGSLGGTVTTKSGDSPAGTTVILVEAGNMDAGAATGGPQQMTVGEDGVFLFQNLVEGTYYAIARNSNYANGRSQTVTLASGQSINDLVIKLGSGGWIEGRVYRNGKPQVGATVLAASIDSGSTGNATTGADGSYRVEDLGAGSYTVTWIPAGSGQISDLGNTASLQATVPEGQGVHLDFGLNGAVLQGSCVPGPPMLLFPVNFALLQEVGSPLPASPGQSISPEDLLRAPKVGSVQIQGTGQFIFEGVPEGVYQISVYYAFPGGGGGGQNGGPGAFDLRLVGFQEQVNVSAGSPPIVIQTRY